MKFTIILLLSLFAFTVTSYSQGTKKREKQAEKKRENTEENYEKLHEKAVKEHIKRQTPEVRKRMKKNLKKSERIHAGKGATIPERIKTKNYRKNRKKVSRKGQI